MRLLNKLSIPLSAKFNLIDADVRRLLQSCNLLGALELGPIERQPLHRIVG